MSDDLQSETDLPSDETIADADIGTDTDDLGDHPDSDIGETVDDAALAHDPRYMEPLGPNDKEAERWNTELAAIKEHAAAGGTVVQLDEQDPDAKPLDSSPDPPNTAPTDIPPTAGDDKDGNNKDKNGKDIPPAGSKDPITTPLHPDGPEIGRGPERQSITVPTLDTNKSKPPEGWRPGGVEGGG